MRQWEIWYVKQQYARKSLQPPQPNDPSDYDRMYLIVADSSGGPTAICCPIQNATHGIGITEVPIPRGYTGCITKDCKIICHEIFTLPIKFFDQKVGFLRASEQDQVRTALIAVFDLA